MKNFEKNYKNGKLYVNGTLVEGKIVAERRCDLDTSYNGAVLDLVEVFDLGNGISATRTYWCRGPGLEKSGVNWSIEATPELIAKIRRRCEDRLRKGTASDVFDTALLLGVGIN